MCVSRRGALGQSTVAKRLSSMSAVLAVTSVQRRQPILIYLYLLYCWSLSLPMVSPMLLHPHRVLVSWLESNGQTCMSSLILSHDLISYRFYDQRTLQLSYSFEHVLNLPWLFLMWNFSLQQVCGTKWIHDIQGSVHGDVSASTLSIYTTPFQLFWPFTTSAPTSSKLGPSVLQSDSPADVS